MTISIPKLFCAFAFIFATSVAVAQEPKKDEKKIQEVVTLDPVSAPPVINADGSTQEDTAGPKPINSVEILKRAVNFVKIESTKYVKGSGVTTGTKAECVATFKYRPKELNPQAEVEGSYTMHLSVEAKEGKYRYTISKITHIAKNADYSGGDINSEVPKCGSMKMSPELWKRIRGEAMKQSTVLISELKAAMKIGSDVKNDKDEW
jgi:hypothetical protein